MHHNFLTTLSLSKKAKKVVVGSIAIEKIKKQQVFLVLVSEDASENTKKKASDKCNYYQIPMFFMDEQLLNQAIGFSNVKIVGITEQGLAKKLIQYKKG